MRILHLISSLEPSGDSARLRTLLKASLTSESDEEACVFTLAPISANSRKKTEGGVPSERLRLREIPSHFNPELFWQSLRMLRKLRFRPDVIHVWSSAWLRPGFHLAKWLKAKSVATLRHADPNQLPFSPILSRFDHLITNSSGIRTAYESRGIHGRWTLIPDVLPPEAARLFLPNSENRPSVPNPSVPSIPTPSSTLSNSSPTQPRTGLRQELHLPDESVLAACVGPIAEWKRWQWAVWSIDSIVRVHPEMHLLFFDPGLENRRERSLNSAQERERRSVAAFAHQYEREAIIHFLPFREDFYELLPQLDFFWSPQSVPGAGLALLEAAAAGIPILSPQLGGMTELLPSDACAWLPENQTTALASETHRLCVQPDRRELQIAQARQAAGRFSEAESLAADCRKLYEK